MSKNRLTPIIQQAIDYQIKYLKELADSDMPTPDDVHDGTLETISSIESIKITEIEVFKDFLNKRDVFFCNVDIVYDSVSGINLYSIMETIKDRVEKMLGLKLNFFEGEVHNKYNDYGQW